MSETKAAPTPGLAGRLWALAGAVGFLTRVPIGTSETAWAAFARFPAAMVLVAYPIAAVLSGVVVVGLPPATAALVFPVVLLGLVGITHLDGLADLGDAAVVHGDAQRRRDVMRDTTVGVGAVAAVVVGLGGLALAALALAGAPWQVALGVVLAAEVTAKFGMVALVGLGTATHEGLASALTTGTGLLAVAGAAALAAPAIVAPALIRLLGCSWPLLPVLAAAAGGLCAPVGVYWWAQRNLGGVNGDVFGAANELARLVALHAGVIAWWL